MTQVWLFGEASIDLEQNPKNEFKRLYKISEDCGYFVEALKKTESTSAHIKILGADSPDGYELEFIANMAEDGQKFRTLQKVLYKLNVSDVKDNAFIKNGRKMMTVQNYLSGEWVEIFNLEKHEINLKGDVRYQQALAKENKKDDYLYTGNGVEKRSCTCIDGDKCPYFACSNCKSQKIEFSNYTHCCNNCNRLQDVQVLEPFIVCKKHGKFDRDDQECPKCFQEFIQ